MVSSIDAEIHFNTCLLCPTTAVGGGFGLVIILLIITFVIFGVRRRMQMKAKLSDTCAEVYVTFCLFARNTVQSLYIASGRKSGC